jgi:phosphoadenosine phosphosulfate reductase
MSGAHLLTPELAAKVERLNALLDSIAARHANVKLASSLAAEDMLLTHAILSRGVKIGIFSLNTGRLHAETLGMLDRVKERYGYDIEQFHPQAAAVEEYVGSHGLNAFYESVDLRKRCCEIRKVEPLARALAGKRAWITGQRRAQAASRAELPEHEFDTLHGLEKFNPLAAWTEDQVWQYLRDHRVPYNRLYDQGYRSIGCAPCTRPVLPGEDARAGRWWWEQAETKECGLHVAPDGRLVRAKVPA